MAKMDIEKMAQNVAEKAIQNLRDNGVFIGRWIPVSERLPEGDDFVLATCKMPFGNLCTYLEILRRTNDGLWTDNLDYYSPDSVIAWMPLPEPYKAESEEKK